MANENPSEALVQSPNPVGVFEEDFSSSPPRKHHPTSTLVVEGPLTPPRSVLHRDAMAKRVSFSEILQEITIDVPPESGLRGV
jgi:hypothetical protein